MVYKSKDDHSSFEHTFSSSQLHIGKHAVNVQDSLNQSTKDFISICMTNQHNLCLTYHLWLYTLGFKPSERIVLWHLNLETWYRLIMTLSCDKRPLPKKTVILRTATFCLSKFSAFFFETICGRCVTGRTSLQILILIFSSVSSFMPLCTRSWNSNPHPIVH